MDANFIILIALFFSIAVIYSSAGFGGGSSYLAVLSLFSVEFLSMRFIALACNVTVVSSSVFLFWKKGILNFRKAWPLVILSVPFAYLGGKMTIEQGVFFIILSISLLISSLLMFFSSSKKVATFNQSKTIGIGGVIGFLSGIVGIGGGIFLSPFLHLSRWDTPKVIAATTAFFILVNSISGIVGQVSSNGLPKSSVNILILIAAVFLGGQIGSRLTIQILKPVTIKHVTAILIFVIALRLLFQQFNII